MTAVRTEASNENSDNLPSILIFLSFVENLLFEGAPCQPSHFMLKQPLEQVCRTGLAAHVSDEKAAAPRPCKPVAGQGLAPRPLPAQGGLSPDELCPRCCALPSSSGMASVSQVSSRVPLALCFSLPLGAPAPASPAGPAGAAPSPSGTGGLAPTRP